MPWCKMYHEIWHDVDFCGLSEKDKLAYYTFLGLASKYGGKIPYDMRSLRCETREPELDVEGLLKAGFLEVEPGVGDEADTLRVDAEVGMDPGEARPVPRSPGSSTARTKVAPAVDGSSTHVPGSSTARTKVAPVVDGSSTHVPGSSTVVDGSSTHVPGSSTVVDDSSTQRRGEERRGDKSRGETPPTPPSGGTAAPAAKRRRQRGDPGWTQPEEASIRRVVALYNAVWGSLVGPTPGNTRVVGAALRGGYSESQLRAAIFASKWGTSWFRDSAGKRKLSVLLRWKCPKGEALILDNLLDDASRIVLRGKVLEAATAAGVLKDLEAVGAKPGAAAKVLPIDDLAKRRADAVRAIEELDRDSGGGP